MKYAFVSLTDKTNLIPFINSLIDDHNYKIIATEGTFKELSKYRDDIIPFSSIFIKPLLKDLIKTIDHRFYLSIFSDLNNKEDMKILSELKIPKISLFLVNLYSLNEDEITNNNMSSMDIGGVSVIRAAAKNHNNNLIIVDPSDYQEILKKHKDDQITYDLKKQYALKAIQYTSHYDRKIASILGKNSLNKVTYGENPHQNVEIESTYLSYTSKLLSLRNRLSSFNNLCDIDLGLNLISLLKEKDDEKHIAIFIKHGIPAAIASSNDSLHDAVITAYNSDSTSIFGGVLVVNNKLTKESIEFLSKIFLEVIAAKAYDDSIEKLMDRKSRIRVIKYNPDIVDKLPKKILNTRFGMFTQKEERYDIEIELKTKTPVSTQFYNDICMAWNIIRYVKSNAIVIFSNGFTLGIGSGRVSRIEAINDAIRMYLQNKKSFKRKIDKIIVASDGFFPFPDSIDALKEIGADIIIQPGGSKNDQKVIDACDQHNISMYFTGKRAFYH